jgi:hypothetical protein
MLQRFAISNTETGCFSADVFDCTVFYQHHFNDRDLLSRPAIGYRKENKLHCCRHRWCINPGRVIFYVGFLGPMVISKDINQGPMIGLFIAAPLGKF